MKYLNDKDLEFLKQVSSSDLDLLVQLLIKDKKGYERLTEELTSEEKYKKHSPNHHEYWELIGAEIQCFGANSLAKMIRGGEGVLYREVLTDVCKKMKIEFQDNNSVERIEIKLMMKILADSIKNMSREDLKEVVNDLDLNIKAFTPEAVVIALQGAIKLGGFAAYQMTAIVANGVARALIGRGLSFSANAGLMRAMGVFAGPIGWIIAGMWTLIDIAGPAYRVTIPAVVLVAYLRANLKYALPNTIKENTMSNHEFEKKKFEEASKKAYDEKQAEFDDIYREKLIISLLGGVNAGKSSAINALTGKNIADIKAVPGWTKEISLYELTTNVYIADTPGMNDIDEDVSKKAEDFIEKDSDLILFFINASVGVTKYDKVVFENIENLGKEIIVVMSRIDQVEINDINDVINHANEVLGVETISISSKKGMGIKRLQTAIASILETKGKELLFLKVLREKEKEVAKWIKGATATAAGIGALPIPGSDIVLLTTLQVGLAMKIAFIYDIKPSKDDVMKLIASTVTGNVGKQIVRTTITLLKAAGWIPGNQLLEVTICGIAASVAASLTFGFGWACNAYYKSGMTIDLGEIKDVFENSYNEYKKKSEKE